MNGGKKRTYDNIFVDFRHIIGAIEGPGTETRTDRKTNTKTEGQRKGPGTETRTDLRTDTKTKHMRVKGLKHDETQK